MEDTWRAATLDEVNRILLDDLEGCDEEQKRAFATFKVAPFRASLRRYGQTEEVYVVAIKDGEAMYWEDVEEGFNVSRLSSDNSLLDHYCNQDPLGIALNSWIERRSLSPLGLAQREAARTLAALGGTQPDLKQVVPRRRSAK